MYDPVATAAPSDAPAGDTPALAPLLAPVIALAQIDPTVGAIAANAELIIDSARRARDGFGAALVVFPELALIGYPPEDLLLRPGLAARVDAALATIAAALPDVAVLLGAPLRDADGLRNAAVLLRDGGIAASYAKCALPNYGVFDELRYFAAGDAPLVFELQGLRCGVTVCEDIWSPWAAARARDAGAQLILNLNASPFHLGKLHEREQVLRARIAECGLPVIYVNQVGGQDELVFDGASMVWDGGGRRCLQMPAFEAALGAVAVTGDGRVEPRGGDAGRFGDEGGGLDGAHISLIYRALVCGVRDYVRKNGFGGAVIGLSGGIDSALTLAVAVDALGAEAIQAVMMPYRYTAQMSVEDARAQAESLGVEFSVIAIEPAVAAFTQMLTGEFAGLAADVTEENLQARSRGVVLMAISNKKGRILLTTGNKSEMAVGYATLYGDMAGGFAPLKDCYKTTVYALAEYRNALAAERGEGEVIPRRVITRPPSAELAPDQLDQDSLPPYVLLDDILKAFVEEDAGSADIVARGHDAPVVERVIRLVLRNEYKRRQAPPGVRVTPRAFGRDRRYPITSGYLD